MANDYRGWRRSRVLCADPPWCFGDALGARGAEANYECLSVQDIMRFPLPPLYDDSLLFLWRVASMQTEAMKVADAWGFTIKAEMVWEKITNGDPPVQAFGLGRYVRNCHEVCLIGTRGRPVIRDHSVRSSFSAPVGRHSEKPDEFYRLAARLAAGPRAELFARRHRRGWQCHGNELKTAA